MATGTQPDRICVVTFNREAALSSAPRITARLAPALPRAGSMEVRTLHALARQILLERQPRLELVPDRLPLLRAARRRCLAGRSPDAPVLPGIAALDAWLSAAKIEGTPPPREAPQCSSSTLGSSQRGARATSTTSSSTRPLRSSAIRRPGDAWQTRFTHVCVDEFQDVDAAQLRLVRLLAEPERNLFVVGDDDQTIYAWRLADVRRILDFGLHYPEARRVQLATNYRCPRVVVERSARLIAVNVERFAKRIEAGPGDGTVPPARMPALVSVPTDGVDWPERLVELAIATTADGQHACFLARTRAELAPLMLALVRRGVAHATAVNGPFDAPGVVRVLGALHQLPADRPPFAAIQAVRASLGWRRVDQADDLGDEDHLALDAFAGWAVGFRTLDRFLAAAARAQEQLARLRQPDAAVELVTVHGAKGREWPTVVVVGFEEERFPNRRALVGAADPARAVEEERRLAYVALTRATRRLVLAYDPARPSRFIAEMGLVASPRGRPRAPRR